MATERAPYRFTVDEYHRMGDAGIFGEGERVELIDGEIIAMSPIGSRHASCVTALTTVLIERLGRAAIVRAQNPVRTSDYGEPEPDIAVLSPKSYWDRHPEPEDTLILIEVADSTIGFDRSRKLPMYARAGLREVWLLDLQDETIERYTDPSGSRYRSITRVGRGGRLESLSIPGLVIATDEILPPPH